MKDRVITAQFIVFKRFIHRLINELPISESELKSALHRAAIKTELEFKLDEGKDRE